MRANFLESPVTIKNIEAFVFRAPIANPVKTSFGIMTNRPAVFVRLEDDNGAVGWGEIWCNFPNCGAEHRATLLAEIFKPLLINQTFNAPEEIYQFLSEKTAVLAIQSGEYGPIAQTIAGIDLAAWDLFSKKSSQALWQYLGGNNPAIKTYASGINPDHPEKVVQELLANGHTAFKLKIGFNEVLDIENLNNIRKLIPSNLLMVDANQAWDLPTAIDRIKALVRFDLNWIEEPIRADSPLSHWQKLSSTHQLRLAAGENMVGEQSFDEAIASGVFCIIQPDIAKWGGISGCLPIIKKLHDHKIEYCPHYLGGGIGLMASAHLLAASSSTGMLEIDSNPNPLRSLLSTPLDGISDGKVVLSSKAGIGIDPDLDALSQFLIH
ncbi:MAG: hypothetical protein RLY75_1081 [Pseudomonadota bacterium]